MLVYYKNISTLSSMTLSLYFFIALTHTQEEKLNGKIVKFLPFFNNSSEVLEEKE